MLVLGARMAYASIRTYLDILGATFGARMPDASRLTTFADTPETFAAAAFLAYAVILLVVLLIQHFQPRLTIPAALLAPSCMFALAAVASGEVDSVLVACAIVVTSWITGDIILGVIQAPISHAHLGAAISLRISLGLGLLGLAVLLLGWFGAISRLPVLALGLLVALLWVTRRRDMLGRQLRRASALKTGGPRLALFESLLVALSAAFFIVAALAALTPETISTGSDSVRQHLPQAREIWQDHAVRFHSTIQTPSASLLGASVNAVAFGFGGFTAIRILQVLVSLCCLLAIAGLGATLGGRLAGIAAVAFFSAIPLVLWLTGHAYPDLLAVLFICSSVQCAIFWQEDGHRIWLLLAGTLAGFSLVTKQISAVFVLALLIALAIFARPGTSTVGRIQATLTLAGACVAVSIPWLVHSAVLTHTIPLLNIALEQLENVPMLADSRGSGLSGESSASPAGPAVAVASAFPGGVTRSLTGIVTGPWDLTFQGAYANWRIVRYGEFGVVLLMFLPLIFVNLCTRRAMLVATTAVVSFVAWVFTIQLPRHLLPSLALLAVLAGLAVAHASQDQTAASRKSYGRLVQVSAIAGLVLTPLFFLPNASTAFPFTVLTGAERSGDYLARVDPAIPALRAATALLPADTPVGYIGEWQGDQSSTEARLVYLGSHSSDERDSLDTQVGDTPEAIFNYLAAWGINYLIWDRPDTRSQDVNSTLLSGEFLLHHATILGGNDGIYLYKLYPLGVPDPTTQENLLRDPEFKNLSKPENIWNGTRRDRAASGELRPRRQKTVTQRVTIDPGQEYLLVVDGRCGSTKDQTEVSLTWRDAHDNVIGTTADSMKLGVTSNSSIMMRKSPGSATTVDVSISTSAGTPCLISKIGMYAYSAS
ncbi:MAG: glycosyltransferase family 39 protein [Thermomicrobiales bacterium]